MLRTPISLKGSDDQLISQETQHKTTVSQLSGLIFEVKDDIDLIKSEEDIVIDDILDSLTNTEFIR